MLKFLLHEIQINVADCEGGSISKRTRKFILQQHMPLIKKSFNFHPFKDFLGSFLIIIKNLPLFVSFLLKKNKQVLVAHIFLQQQQQEKETVVLLISLQWRFRKLNDGSVSAFWNPKKMLAPPHKLNEITFLLNIFVVVIFIDTWLIIH